MWAIEGERGAGKTAVLAELAHRGHACIPEPPPADDSADALLAREIATAAAFAKVPTDTPVFVERSPVSLAAMCRAYAAEHPSLRLAFEAVADSVPITAVGAHFVLPKCGDDTLAALRAGSGPLVHIANAEPVAAADAVLAATNPAGALFM